MRVLSFDIGIKNLAWALLEKNGENYTLLGWDNYNLLTESSNGAPVTSTTCSHCKAKAVLKSPLGVSCQRHCPPGYPALTDLSGNKLKKVPIMALSKKILLAKGVAKPPSKKEELEEVLSKIYSLPIVVQKVSKAPDVGLIQIHDSIRALVEKQKPLWSTCSVACLENQPAFKNPTMKSVQMLLFATLRDILQPSPPAIRLVHAGKKVKGAEKGDSGYKERKAGSESRIDACFQDAKFQNSSQWKQTWESAKKKSDLADAFCMCLDATPPSA